MTHARTPIRAAIVGLGHHGARIARLAAGAGIDIVAAADPATAGASLGETVDAPAYADVVIAKDFDALNLRRGDVDVLLLTHNTTIEDLAELEIRGAELGANVVTIVVEGFDLDEFPTDLHERVDAAAKANGVTVVATGSQDVSWAGLIVQASSQVRDIAEIRLALTIGIDGYPASFVDGVGVGLDADAFRARITEGEAFPSIGAATVKRAGEKLGLTLIGSERTLAPVIAEEAIESETYGRTLEVGEIIGMRDTTVFSTAEGIDLVAVFDVVAYLPGVKDRWIISFQADPVVELEQRITVPPSTVDAILLHRIPDVIAAPAGHISALDLPQARYRHVISAD